MGFKLNLDKFVVWWVFGFPVKIYTILNRILALTNNEIGFTLNIRLFFTPLFGDYTIVGRVMGVIFRILRIASGIFLTAGILVLYVLALPVWYLLPLVIFYKTGFFGFFYILSTYLSFLFIESGKPEKRVTKVTKADEVPQAAHFSPNILSGVEAESKAFISELLAAVFIKELLVSLEIEPSVLENRLLEVFAALKVNSGQLLGIALNLSKENGSRYVEIEHVFLALLSQIPKSEVFLDKLSLTSEIVKSAAFWHVQGREDLAKIFFWQDDYVLPPIGGVNRGWTGRVTRYLDQFSQDYTKMAQKGYFDKIVGKDKALEDAINALSKGTSNNLLIIGEPGSGKTSLIKGIAQEIIHGTRAEALKFKRLVALEPGALIAGCKTPGDVSERIENVVKEVTGSGNIIIFVDEVHNLIASTGSENAQLSTVFSTLEPHLSSGEFQFIGATSIPEYRRYIEPNGAFSRLFEVVKIEEATPNEALEVLKVLVKKYQKIYGVSISFASLYTIITLSSKLIRDRVLPDKAVDVLERACVAVSKSTRYVTRAVVEKVISDITKVPVAEIDQDESQKLLSLEVEMKKRVIGQDGAIDQIADALRRARVGVRDERRPIAGFLFVGSTGVGKTETAKALAETYFGNENMMIRLDMSEYQGDNSIDKLIGTPDGKTIGLLTEKVRTMPFSLILLDEIEKASPKVLLAFLQVLDDGRLTDSTGRVIDFTNSIIIATSNVGTAKIQEVLARDGSYEEMSSLALVEVKQRFAPEFLNRFSGVIVFKPLYPAEVFKITQLLLSGLAKRIKAKNISVTFSDQLVKKLAEKGFDATWGARPLRRLIENTVESYLAKKILAKEIQVGDEVELKEDILTPK